MKKQLYDVIVIGLGSMGSTTAYQLAKRGQRVLGLERFGSPHDQGSHHGGSRIIRQAYFEDPAYVPLLLRAYELWEEIERESGTNILNITGGLMMGSENSLTVKGSIESAKAWNLSYEILDAKEINRKFTTFTPANGTIALYEKKAGFVRPENSVLAHLLQAEKHGAELRFYEPVIRWEAHPSGEEVIVTTADGVYEAGRLVISPGAWAPNVLEGLGLKLQIERQVMMWFAPTNGIEPFRLDQFPIYIWEAEDGMQFYGFPSFGLSGEGAKVAFFRMGQPCTAETIDRTVYDFEIARMREYIGSRIPQLNGKFLQAKTCLYSNTPDEHFVISLHPEYKQVAIGAGFSGHGFKFASVVGEILADLATEGTTSLPIELFSPKRFSKV
ncbi:N-methyl-L-tryptophan oxidase [Paenibacillus solisilvae]|uniref:N-methyl-L-tryptophan oxidase n=1 Tax=Paenibacillus solisilvae TaxID=2486751 RepID=A0ABW0VUU0_9BACL